MLTAWSFSFLVGAALAGPTSTAAIPREIVEHYRDHNFVNAFSTSSERRWIADDRQPPADKRLARVAELLARMTSRVDEIDPGIMAHDVRHESEFRSDLVRISSCSVDEEAGEAWVRLEVLALDEGAVVTLVGSYDRLTRKGRSTPDVDQLMAATTRPTTVVTREVHRWRRIDGLWRRDAAAYLLGSL
jgi:hypothetical protein